MIPQGLRALSGTQP